MKEKIPVIYLEMHDRLFKKFGLEEFETKELIGIFGRIYHIRKNLRYAVLQDMITLNLISKITKMRLSLVGLKMDVNNTSKVYQQVGLY